MKSKDKKPFNMFERPQTMLKTCLCGHNEKFNKTEKKKLKKKLKPEKLFVYK